MDWDAVKGFGKVNGSYGCAAGGEVLVETVSNGGGKIKE